MCIHVMLQTTLNYNQRPIHLIFWIFFIANLKTAAAGGCTCTRINLSTKATQYLPFFEWIQKALGWINSWPHVVQISRDTRKLQILHLRYDLIAPLWPTRCDMGRSCRSARDETRSTFSLGPATQPGTALEARDYYNNIKTTALISCLQKSHKSCVDLHPQFPWKLFSVTSGVQRCLGRMRLQKAVLSWWAVTGAVSLPRILPVSGNTSDFMGHVHDVHPK